MFIFHSAAFSFIITHIVIFHSTLLLQDVMFGFHDLVWQFPQCTMRINLCIKCNKIWRFRRKHTRFLGYRQDVRMELPLPCKVNEWSRDPWRFHVNTSLHSCPLTGYATNRCLKWFDFFLFQIWESLIVNDIRVNQRLRNNMIEAIWRWRNGSKTYPQIVSRQLYFKEIINRYFADIWWERCVGVVGREFNTLTVESWLWAENTEGSTKEFPSDKGLVRGNCSNLPQRTKRLHRNWFWDTSQLN